MELLYQLARRPQHSAITKLGGWRSTLERQEWRVDVSQSLVFHYKTRQAEKTTHS